MRSHINLVLGRLIGQRRVGIALKCIFRDSIPTGYGRYNATDSCVSPEIVARMFFRFYERAEIRLVSHHLPPHSDVIELGSSLGLVSLSIASRLAAGRRLVCVEANPHLLECLARNAQEHMRHLSFELVNAAVDYSGSPRTVFRVSEDTLGGAVSIEQAGDTTGALVNVPVATLGDIHRRAGLEDFSLVCDIEGSEVGMIMGDGQLLSQHCRLLIIELHVTSWKGRRYEPAEVLKLLERIDGFKHISSFRNVHAFRNYNFVGA